MSHTLQLLISYMKILIVEGIQGLQVRLWAFCVAMDVQAF